MTLPEFKTINLTIKDSHIAILTLDRPEKHNVLNEQMISEITVVANWVDQQSEIRCLIITGRGRSFCAGGDFNWMKSQFETHRENRIQQAMSLAKMLKVLNELSKLTIAKINGSAYGGGLGIIAVCDIVIASDKARFSLTETKFGLIPATIGPYIVQKIGEGAARRMMLNAKLISAQEAKQLALVHEVADLDELDELVQREVDAVLLTAPGALASAKNFLFSLRNCQQSDLSIYSANLLADRWESIEAQDGIAAFFKGEDANWVVKDLKVKN